MARVDLTKDPYFRDKIEDTNITSVLFIADRALQQRELNTVQGIVDEHIKRLGDSTYVEGSPITGMDFNVDDDTNELVVQKGLVYLEGLVRMFAEQSVTITRQGRERIGLFVEQEVIRPEDDPSLLDPTQDAESEDAKGAERLQETVKMKLMEEDDEYPVLMEFEDGQLLNERLRPNYSGYTEQAAVRTYEESGNYRVDGFEMYTEESDSGSHITLVVDPGTAYVRGYRVKKQGALRTQVPKSQTTREVIRERNTYDSSERRVKLGSRSVSDVDIVLGESETSSSGITVSKGQEDGRDALPTQYSSIHTNSVEVWEQDSSGSTTQTYEYDRDFRLTVAEGRSYIDWDTGDLNGQQPEDGTTYRVYMVYDRQMIEDTDFKIVVEEPENDETIGWDTFIDFNNMGGAKPRSEGLVSADYSFFLARQDRVLLNQYGEIELDQGQPDTANRTAPPSHEDSYTLSLGTLLLYPNSNKAKANLKAITRLRFDDLQRMKRRIERLDYNFAIQSLEEQQSSAYDPLELRGQLVDPFMDMSRADMSQTTAAFSFEDGQITIPTTSPNDKKKRPQMSDSLSEAVKWGEGRIVSAPYSENRAVWQPKVSEAWNVNPYNVFSQTGVLSLNPSSDNWIEEEKITVTEDTEPESIRVQRWWGHPDRDPDADTEWVRNNVNFNSDDVDMESGAGLGGWSNDNTSDQNTQTGTAIRDGGQRTKEEMIEYIRQRDVDIHVKNLLPNVNNMYFSFDGVRVPLEPRNGTQAGSDTGTVRSDSRGEVYARFHIPPGIRCGTREVILENDSESMAGRNVAMGTYTAHGTRKITEDVILRTRVTAIPWDPLAQSFIFRNDRVVTSVGLYFMSKDDNDSVTVQIRGLSDGGQPNQTIHAETVLDPENVNISEDASVETKVHFNDPLMADAGKSYCIVILTNSDLYTMGVATMGNQLLNNPSEFVNLQPYPAGVLFSSSNSVSWTTHNESDLKFAVYTAEFNEEAVLEFDTMTDTNADQIMLMATHLTPQSTGCRWEAKVLFESESGNTSIEQKEWEPIINYLEQETQDVVDQVKLRATFKSNRYISPLLSTDDIEFINFVSLTEGDYFSRNVNAEEAPYNTITMSYFKVEPSGTSVTPKYSTDGGSTWNEFTVEPEIERRNSELSQVTYEERISTDATNTQFKVKLELRSDNRLVRPRVQRLMCLFNDAFND